MVKLPNVMSLVVRNLAYSSIADVPRIKVTELDVSDFGNMTACFIGECL